MSSAGKTSNINLNQWIESDKPRMEDFNTANILIDSAIKRLQPVSGAWTPVIYGLTTAGSYLLSRGLEASYTKIGSLVHASFWINGITIQTAGTGVFAMRGLPFASKAAAGGSMGYASGYGSTGPINFYMHKNSSALIANHPGIGNCDISKITEKLNLVFSITYEIAA